MDIFVLAAFGSAICWAVTPFLSFRVAGMLGGWAFNRLRILLASVLLAPVLLIAHVQTGALTELTAGEWPLLIASSLFGLFIGDSALFIALRRLGPRRNQIVFSLHAPITVALGFVILKETVDGPALLGIALIIAGVILAVWFGGLRRGQIPGYAHVMQAESNGSESRTAYWEAQSSSLFAGILFGLIAATGQAVAAITLKPVIIAGHDIVTLVCLRVMISCLAYLLTLPLKHPLLVARTALTPEIIRRTGLSALLGVVAGMALYTFALGGSNTGIIATVVSTSPVISLPLVWLLTGKPPPWTAWLGAIMVAAGLALI